MQPDITNFQMNITPVTETTKEAYISTVAETFGVLEHRVHVEQVYHDRNAEKPFTQIQGFIHHK